jgi:glutamate-ammonia-ligase adenylyltransferase
MPVEAYQQYYASRVQLWELQALTRARPIVGPCTRAFIELAQSAWRSAGQQPDLPERIDEMRERIRRERSPGTEFVSFKTGTGGLIEAEFLVQALQMHANLWEPNWTEAVNLLAARRELSSAQASALKSGYYFLRRIESVLRRYENVSVSALPGDDLEFLGLSRRLGLKSADELARASDHARNTIHEIYQEKFSSEPPIKDGEKTSPPLAERKR